MGKFWKKLRRRIRGGLSIALAAVLTGNILAASIPQFSLRAEAAQNEEYTLPDENPDETYDLSEEEDSDEMYAPSEEEDFDEMYDSSEEEDFDEMYDSSEEEDSEETYDSSEEEDSDEMYDSSEEEEPDEAYDSPEEEEEDFNDEFDEEYIFSEEELQWIAEARGALQPIADEWNIMALVYLCESYDVREAAGADSGVVATVFSGQTVNILDVELVVGSRSISAWERVSFYLNGVELQGYIQREYLACSDERFLAWEEAYGMNPGEIALYAAGDAKKNTYADIEMFPKSYRAALKELKKEHPNWTFVPLQTGLKWQTVINNEIKDGRSLVHSSLPNCTKEGSYDGGSWYYASEAILKYYMDPRNALTENGIFQFELLTYNESYHTQAAVDTFLSKTFMSNDQKAPGTSMTFAEIFCEVGAQKNVSPFHLAARVYQEQGKGKSALISGTYAGKDGSLKGYYNYFNVGATGKSNEDYIINGLTYAKKQGWSDAYKSIDGGSAVISANYIQKGQDTLYLQKFNVNPQSANALFTHQYMQNISAPTTEAASVKKLYAEAKAIDSTFVFKIPVYNNMPSKACAYPSSSKNVVLQVPQGYDTTIWLDGVPYSSVRRNGSCIVTAKDTKAKTAVVYQYDSSDVPVGMYVWTLSYKDKAYQATAQSGLKDLLTYHGCSIRITGKAGIRFKSGISKKVKKKLIDEGVNGYHLKEYGTLVMNNANRDSYPMICGGEKVSGGMAYGTNKNGKLTDTVYETVGGRQRFTLVLVGLPTDQYKVEYAFRSYAKLEKNGTEIIVYGPVVARSIYALAEQVLDMGTYPKGSSEYKFLKKLIKKAGP